MFIYLMGGWGYGNKGDNAILNAMLQTFASRFPYLDVTTTSYSTDELRAQHNLSGIDSLHRLLGRGQLWVPLRWLSVALWRLFGSPIFLSPELKRHFRMISDAEVLVLGGGGYFNDQWKGMLLSLYVALDMAAASGTPVVIYGQTLGPFSDETVRGSLKRRLEKVAAVAYRDSQSERVATQSGIRGQRLRLTADEANLLSAAPIRSPAPSGPQDLDIGVMCQSFRVHLGPAGPSSAGCIKSADDYAERLCEALCEIKASDSRVHFCFIPSTTWDADFCRSIFEEVNRRTKGDATFYPCEAASEFIQRCQSVDLMLSTNMHPVILASTACVPSVALSYHYKVDDYMKSIGLGEFVLRIDDFQSGDLIELLRAAISRRDALSSTVRREHRKVRRLARGNADVLASVLNEVSGNERAPVEEGCSVGPATY